MATSTAQSSAIWELVARQHGVVSHRQLTALGLSAAAIRHRRVTGRLRPRHRGVYVAGRPELSRRGELMAAVLACGDGAALSHTSAAELAAMAARHGGQIEVSVPADRCPRPSGVTVHRRATLTERDIMTVDCIPVTGPVRTLIDLAAIGWQDGALERAVNEADRLDLVDPEALRLELDDHAGQPGVARLRGLLDRRTFRLTDSELERLFLAIARDAGLPLPLTRQWVNGYRVDFYWPDLGLVVETDGLRYHRTAAEQAIDRKRDQVHLAAGLTPLRFTHAQVSYGREDVRTTLVRVARRLENRRPPRITSSV